MYIIMEQHTAAAAAVQEGVKQVASCQSSVAESIHTFYVLWRKTEDYTELTHLCVHFASNTWGRM